MENQIITDTPDPMEYSSYMESNPGATMRTESSTSDVLTTFTSHMKDGFKYAQTKVSSGFHKAADRIDKALTSAEPSIEKNTLDSVISSIGTDLQCVWCNSLLNAPVTLPCGHSLCSGCWITVKADPKFEGEDDTCTCPECFVPVSNSINIGLNIALVTVVSSLSFHILSYQEEQAKKLREEKEELERKRLEEEAKAMEALTIPNEPKDVEVENVKNQEEGESWGSWFNKIKSETVDTIKEGYDKASVKVQEKYSQITSKENQKADNIEDESLKLDLDMNVDENTPAKVYMDNDENVDVVLPDIEN